MPADSDHLGAGLGPFQQQRPPLFPGGVGPPGQGHPVFPIGQAPGPAATANVSSEPASQPRPLFPVGQGAASGAAPAQGDLPKASAGAQPGLQPQPVFPIGQSAAIGGQLAAGPSINFIGQPALQPQPALPAEGFAASSASLAPGQAGGAAAGHRAPSAIAACRRWRQLCACNTTPAAHQAVPNTGRESLAAAMKTPPPSACLLRVPFHQLAMARKWASREDSALFSFSTVGSCIWSRMRFGLAVQGTGHRMAACILHPHSMMRLLWMSQTQQSYGKRLTCRWYALKNPLGCMCQLC